MRRLLSLGFMVTAWLVAALPSTVTAQAYPARPIKVIVPFPPGSAADGSARLMGDELRKRLGQTVVIENQVGADGIVGAQVAKRAPADGYTLFLSTNSTHAANLSLHANLPYDPEKDFDPVAGYVRVPMILLVKKDFPADEIEGFVRQASQRATGKPLSYGSGNTAGQVAAALLKSATKLEMTHVPYKGSAQALQDLVGGHLDFLFTDAYSPLGLVNTGQLKVLGVADQRRHPLLPKVPTFAEAGYKDMDVVAWNGFFVPAGTDAAIVQRLNKEINEVLAKPEIVEALQKTALTPMVMTPVELKTYVGSEIVRWKRIIELAGIQKQ